jgi:hypothetical protein
MSYQIGLDTIFLRPTPRLGHIEYCDHGPLVRAVERNGKGNFNTQWELDFLWNTQNGPVDWARAGRVTDMGHAEFMEGGVDRREPRVCPFKRPEEVLEFDAVKEYGLPNLDKLVLEYEDNYQTGQKGNPEQVFPGGYYRTIVSGAIETFGWEMLLLAAADQDGFERVLDSFFRLSLRHYEAWAKTSIKVFICHDDMVWTQGPFMHPDFYRRVIFPRYRKLWSVLKAAGKKVLYCSDGNWSQFVDDIAAAGADGFIFEPMMALDPIVAKYGRTHVIAGSKVDCRTLTFETRKEIRAEIDATLPLAFQCPGFMFAIGNHIPANIPLENALFYLDYLKQHWQRK